MREAANARDLEERMLDRCAAIGRDEARTALDQREANVFRLAAMVVQSRFADASRHLMRASDDYFSVHPGEKLHAAEVVRKNWVVGLPRLRDRLTERLTSR